MSTPHPIESLGRGVRFTRCITLSPLASRPSPGAALRLSPLASRLVIPATAGFTLIELVITVAIVAILASGLIPLTQLAAQRSKEQELRSSLREIRTAIDAYKKALDDGRVEKKVDQTGYPPKLEVLADGVKDIKTPDGTKIYFLRRIPRDPFSEDASVAASKTWGLRSYASPPDDPREGDDVYDVYSPSGKVGLNGVPYKDW
jgi:general secretion pathway protein G